MLGPSGDLLGVYRKTHPFGGERADRRRAGERPRVLALPGGGVRLVLRDGRVSVVRTATLSPEEAELLARHPAGAWALGVKEAGGPAEQLAAAAPSKKG